MIWTVQEHVAGDKRAQIQASFARLIIEQQMRKIRNRAVDHTLEIEEEIWKRITSMILNNNAIDYVHWDDPN